MKQIQLVGASDEESESALSASHRKVFEHLVAYKEGKVDWTSFDSIQNDLMDVTGYMKKEVNFVSNEIVVSFDGHMFHNTELVGKGKNELEAICDACKNFVINPYNYNTASIRYVTQLKKEFPGIVK
jgi:hypothetical protein